MIILISITVQTTDANILGLIWLAKLAFPRKSSCHLESAVCQADCFDGFCVNHTVLLFLNFQVAQDSILPVYVTCRYDNPIPTQPLQIVLKFPHCSRLRPNRNLVF
jgi:hypothetical protein